MWAWTGKAKPARARPDPLDVARLMASGENDPPRSVAKTKARSPGIAGAARAALARRRRCDESTLDSVAHNTQLGHMALRTRRTNRFVEPCLPTSAKAPPSGARLLANWPDVLVESEPVFRIPTSLRLG